MEDFPSQEGNPSFLTFLFNLLNFIAKNSTI
nr:MAG TPA: hypothetical protein [Caudoviricetes sp.]